MKLCATFLCIAAATIGCKKSSGPGGGGGGGWLVGSSGLMSNIHDGTASGYELGSTEQLNGIACRGLGEAWVVGNRATVLYTDDAGGTWVAQEVPTTADLRTLATQDDGPVFVAGAGTLLMSGDTGTTWHELSNGSTNFRSLGAASDGTTVMAVAEDGGLWAYNGSTLAPRTTLPGARAVAVSSDGNDVVVAGTGLWRSSDGGSTFAPLSVAANLVFDDVRLNTDREAIAVGASGAIAMITADGQVVVQHVGSADLHALRVGGSGWGDAISYTAGDGGQVWMSQDRGWSWTAGPNVGRTVFGIDEIGEGHR